MSARGIGIDDSGTFCSIRIDASGDGHPYGCNGPTNATIGRRLR